MTAGDKKDSRLTREEIRQFLSGTPSTRDSVEKNWLGHTKGSRILDAMLVPGATLRDLISKSERSVSGVMGHMQHLERPVDVTARPGHGLPVLRPKDRPLNDPDGVWMFDRLALGIIGDSTFELLPGEADISSGAVYIEGTLRQVSINAFERNTEARRACVEHWKAVCDVCGFDFKMVYGSVADGFIHVHHLIPLSAIRREYIVDPVKDLRPVCPNCHAVLHMRNPPFSIKEARILLKRRIGDFLKT